jgi:hypothetical protein
MSSWRQQGLRAQAQFGVDLDRLRGEQLRLQNAQAGFKAQVR